MSETTSLKKSFFGGYFRYKLRSLRGFAVVFAVLNFLLLTGLSAAVLITVEMEEDIVLKAAGSGMYNMSALFFFMFVSYALAAAMIVGLIIMTVMPAVNFNFFNKRADMDTIGGLPLTSRQRFLGDVLSGAAAFGISFVPCSVIAVIIAAVAQTGPLKELEALISDKYDINSFLPWGSASPVELILNMILTALLSFLTTYAISCFVASCCGKVGTSIIFSIFASVVFTILTNLYGSLILDCAVGYDTQIAINEIVSVIPPIGAFNSAYQALSGQAAGALTAPVFIVISLIATALFGIGAYFVSKRRKAEYVGREIVFDAGYFIISAVVTVTVGGFFFPMLMTGRAVMGLAVPILLIALAVCFVLEFLRKRSRKTLWKGFAVFAASSLCSLAFTFAVTETHGFGISYYIPSKQSIESVEVYGNLINDLVQTGRTVTIKTDSGISTVLSEHKKMIDDLDKVRSDNKNPGLDAIRLKYNFKNGSTQTRYYFSAEYNVSHKDDVVYQFAEAISKLPELSDRSLLGILEDPDRACVNMIYSGKDPKDLDDEDPDTTLVIKLSERDRFIECFRDGFLNADSNSTANVIGVVKYEYLDANGDVRDISLVIRSDYDKAIDFLGDPENIKESSDITVDISQMYEVQYRPNDDTRIDFKLTRPELAREFLSYVEAENAVGDDEISEAFTIRDGEYNSFIVRKSNEKAALGAYIKAIRAHTATGGGSNDQN